MMLPLFVGRDVSIRAVEEALSRDRLIFLVSQKNSAEENPSPEGIHGVGTIASIMRMIKLADGRVKILVQGLAKGEVGGFVRERPFFEVNIRKVVEPPLTEMSIEVEALMRTAKEKIEQILNLKNLPPEIVMVTDNISDPRRVGRSRGVEPASENRGKPGDSGNLRSHSATKKSQ